MRRVAGAAILALVLIAVASLAVERSARETTRESFASSYDSGPNGMLALYDVLRAQHVRVARFERPFAFLPKSGTLVLATTRFEAASPTVVAQSIEAADQRAVAAFAKSGGHVVIFGDPDFQWPVATGVQSGTVSSDANVAARVLDVPQSGGATALDGPFTAAKPFALLRDGYPLFGTRAGAVAYTVPAGRGDITVVNASSFDNAHLRSGENVVVADALLTRGGTVYFDEYLHGYDAGKTFWSALPEPVHVAVYVLAIAIAAFLIEANVRIAPPIPLDAPDERDSSAYLASMARLLRRARAARAAVRRFADDAARLTRMRERPQLHDWTEELRRLAALERPSDADVRRAAVLHALIRKDAS